LPAGAALPCKFSKNRRASASRAQILPLFDGTAIEIVQYFFLAEVLPPRLRRADLGNGSASGAGRKTAISNGRKGKQRGKPQPGKRQFGQDEQDSQDKILACQRLGVNRLQKARTE
jgi:hypothetical protein